MSVNNPDNVITEQRLSEFYQGILPYLGGMPTVLYNKFSKNSMYSTDERMIGQWIDGKPLYQKTYDCGTLPNNNISSVSLGIANLDTVAWFDGVANNSSDGTSMQLGYASFDNYGIEVKVINKDHFEIYSKQNRSAFHGYITIQYTKTTDSPVDISTGEFTDYSTEEKIIGTWIDGSPLYQKVVPVDLSLSWNSSYYAYADTSPLVSNVDRIIYSCAYLATLTDSCTINYTNSSSWRIIVPEREGNIKYILLQYTKTTD